MSAAARGLLQAEHEPCSRAGPRQGGWIWSSEGKLTTSTRSLNTQLRSLMQSQLPLLQLWVLGNEKTVCQRPTTDPVLRPRRDRRPPEGRGCFEGGEAEKPASQRAGGGGTESGRCWRAEAGRAAR